MRIPPKTVSTQMPSGPAKEGWSVDRFERAYNAVAVRESGYAFQRDPEHVKAAEKAYLSGRHTSLEKFAESWFETEQRT